MSKSRKVLICILIAVIALILAGGIFAFTMLSRIHYISVDEAEEAARNNVTEVDDLGTMPETKQTLLTDEEKAALLAQSKTTSVKNVLLIGIDRRGQSGEGRSDSIFIATLDGKNKRLKLTSIMRDTYIDIPGEKANRINVANARGGPGLLMETINTNFAMHLQKYVLVDFRMFTKLVDVLGGITLHLSNGEINSANLNIRGLNAEWGQNQSNNLIAEREEGEINLNGAQALGYARIRHFGNGDYSRTSRQFKVLNAIFKKYKTLSVSKQAEILYGVLPYIETNLDKAEILSLSMSALGMNVSDLMHYRLPVEGYYHAASVRGMSVLIPDIAGNAKLLHDFIYNASEVAPLIGSDTEKGSKPSRAESSQAEDEEETQESAVPSDPVLSASPPVASSPTETPMATGDPSPTLAPSPSAGAETPSATSGQ